MDLRNVKCPNCAGNNIVESSDGRFHCQSCGSFFMLQANAADVEYQKLKVDEAAQAGFQEALVKSTFKRTIILFIILFLFIAFFVLSFFLMSAVSNSMLQYASGLPTG